MKAKSVDDVLQSIAKTEGVNEPPRLIARRRVAEYRKGTAIDPLYNFSEQPHELRQVVYNGTARFYCRSSWWSRLLFRRGYVRKSRAVEYESDQ